MIENLILLGVTAFLGYKLYEVLGKERGIDRNEVRSAKAASRRFSPPEEKAQDILIDEEIMPEGKAVQATFKKIQSRDAGFDPAEFLNNATAAFEMIIKAFVAQDLDALKKLLAPDVFADFKKEVERLKRKKYRQFVQITSIRSVKYKDAQLNADEAAITIEFISEQISVTKDEENRIQDGDPHTPEKVTDLWTFSRNLKTDDPTWLLSSTGD